MELGKLMHKMMKTPGRIPMNIIYRIPGLAKRISDKAYVSFIYLCCFGKKLNLENPKTFNEKLQWLKLYDRNPLYTKLVDKYEVRQYISSKIGEEYLIPLLGVWDNFDSIDFNSLPGQFVLKCTHDSGGVAICRDKSNINLIKVRKKIEKSLNRDFFLVGREWPYKNVKPRIIAEKLMKDNLISEMRDYKFYCFNGKPRYLYVSQGMENHSTARMCFFDMDFNEAPFYRSDYMQFTEKPVKPKNFEKMIQIAKELSMNFSFLRVDLYEINGQVYFSELTFHPCSGLMPFKPKEYDEILGRMLVLSDCKKEVLNKKSN